MTSVTWTIDDENGTNPTGKPGVIEFDVMFEFEPGDPGIMRDSNMDGYPGFPPQAHIDSALCTHLWLDDEDKRKPVREEIAAFSSWFFTWLAQHPNVERALCELGLEANTPNYDNAEY